MLYNNGAPIDYQPERFKPGDENSSRIHGLSTVADSLAMRTGFHEYVFLYKVGKMIANRVGSWPG